MFEISSPASFVWRQVFSGRPGKMLPQHPVMHTTEAMN